MLKNFLFTAIRTFLRNKTFTFLGIIGLTLSIGSVIAIYTIINFHTNFDQHQVNYNSIYRSITRFEKDNQTKWYHSVPSPLSKSIKENVLGVEAVSNVYLTSLQLSVKEQEEVPKKIFQRRVAFVEPAIDSILSIHWLAGVPKFNSKSQVAISATVADKLFNLQGDFEKAVGREIELANTKRMYVSGVYEDFPKNTDYPFMVMSAFENQSILDENFDESNWGKLNSRTECLMKVRSGAQIEAIESRIVELFETNKLHEDLFVALEPLSDVHSGGHGNFSGIGFQLKYFIMSYAMIFVLIIIGCVNFVNLSTARAINRSKEVGLRKIMGGTRFYLILQFLIESMLLVLVALGFGFFLADQIIVGFNTMIGNSELGLYNVSVADWILFSLVTVGMLTIMSGLYPAILLSSFSPINALKIKASNIDKQYKIPVRKILVGVQFAFSIVLLFISVVMFYQIDFMKDQEVGFKSDGVVNLKLPSNNYERNVTLRNEMFKISQVSNISLCIGSPIANLNRTGSVYNAELGPEVSSEVNVKYVDENYLKMFDIDLIAGRNVLPSERNSRQVIINERLVKMLRFQSPEDALGKIISPTVSEEFKYTVVGVIADFKVNSLRKESPPVLMRYHTDQMKNMAILVNTQSNRDMQLAINEIEGAWDRIYPDEIISYSFLEESVANLYSFEEVMVNSITFFVFIFFSCKLFF